MTMSELLFYKQMVGYLLLDLISKKWVHYSQLVKLKVVYILTRSISYGG